MNVVSNTSPLIFLSKLNAFDLLPQCFDQISIPVAVRHELKNLVLPDSILCHPISELGSYYVKGAIGHLHAGELEAIVLTQETRADMVLLDDLSARNKAKQLGLSIMGTAGVLKLANAQGILSKKRTIEYYDELIHEHGLYLSPKILTLLKSTLS
jgi:predicted nucleic acid-binding protein